MYVEAINGTANRIPTFVGADGGADIFEMSDPCLDNASVCGDVPECQDGTGLGPTLCSIASTGLGVTPLVLVLPMIRRRRHPSHP